MRELMLCPHCHRERARCGCRPDEGAQSDLLPPLPAWRRELQDRVDAYRARRPEADDDARVLPFPPAMPPAPAAGKTARLHLRALSSAAAEPIADPVPAPISAPAATPQPEAAPRPAAVPQADAPAWSAPKADDRCLQLMLPMAAAAQPQATLPPLAPRALRMGAGLADAGAIVVAALLFALAGWASQGFPAFTMQDLRPLLPALLAVPALLASIYLLLCAYTGGTTAGMRWFGLQLAGLDGALTPAACRRRGWASLVSLAALGMGFAWALCDSQQLSWHDAMSRTCLVCGGEATSSAASLEDEGGAGAPPR